MSLPSWLSKPVRWLRAGYPHGAPRHSYVPLLALMPSKAVEVEDLRQGGEDPLPRICRDRAGTSEPWRT